jgi:hypothetical protein
MYTSKAAVPCRPSSICLSRRVMFSEGTVWTMIPSFSSCAFTTGITPSVVTQPSTVGTLIVTVLGLAASFAPPAQIGPSAAATSSPINNILAILLIFIPASF